VDRPTDAELIAFADSLKEISNTLTRYEEYAFKLPKEEQAAFRRNREIASVVGNIKVKAEGLALWLTS
jgi:hypothetical protein